MKLRKLLMPLLCTAMIISMTACLGEGTTDSSKYPESIWESAVSKAGIREYVREHQDELDQEALKLAAGDNTISLNGQLKATVLLCELDYQTGITENGDSSENDIFAASYPVSEAYANDFLTKAGTETEAFWEALEPVPDSYNYFMTLFAAAGSVGGETLVQLTMERPDGYSEYEDSILSAVQKWLTADLQHFTAAAEALAQAGFFKDQQFSDLKKTLLDNDSLMPADADSGLSYIRVIRDTMLPVFEQDFTEDFNDLKTESELLEDTCYMSGLAVTIPDTMEFTDEGETAEAIELEGKKVIAFYHNTSRQEYPDSPEPLRILGDFMLALSPEQFPDTLEEADYWLVLTPNYVLGDYYQTSSEGSQQIQEVYSITSIDLYHAADGRRLRHLGAVKEKPSASIFYRICEDRSPLEYPQMISADVLAYIYQNINEPEAFRYMLEEYSENQTALGVGDSAGIGTWELLLNSYEFVDSFTDGSFLYTPQEGNKFLRCQFTVTNHNNQDMSLFPLMYHTGTDLYAELEDREHNIYQPLGGVHSADYFGSTSFDPGESLSAYILFEVPVNTTFEESELNLKFSIKPLSVGYILN